MIGAATRITDIQVVTAIDARDGASELTFRGGLRAILPADHPDHDVILQQAESSLREGYLVGVLVDSLGRLVDLRYAIRSRVRLIKDDQEEPNRLEVWFWAYSPLCYLTRDHPEFERIRSSLTDAVSTGNLVWVAPHGWPVTGETETWMKIMDVRPSEWPETTTQRNGTA
jgi:hypothetical protein